MRTSPGHEDFLLWFPVLYDHRSMDQLHAEPSFPAWGTTSNADLPGKLQVRAGQCPQGRTRGTRVTAELCNSGEKLRQNAAGDRAGKQFLLLSWVRASGSVSHPELPWLQSKDY